MEDDVSLQDIGAWAVLVIATLGVAALCIVAVVVCWLF
jgi:hypothetical protein